MDRGNQGEGRGGAALSSSQYGTHPQVSGQEKTKFRSEGGDDIYTPSSLKGRDFPKNLVLF